jgi:CRP-like cAMP-binding protein
MNPEELKRIPVLQSMDSAALGRLAAALEELKYIDGATVFAQGDPGDAMYFVAEGHVRVELRTDSEGHTYKTLAILGPGEHFGEMSLCDHKPRSASAVTIGPTVLLRLPKASFDSVMRHSSEAGMSLLFGMIRTSSDRIRWLSSQIVVYDEIGKAIGESKQLQELLDVVLHQLCVATLADWGLLLLKPQFSGELELRAAEGLSLSAEQERLLAAGRGFLERLLQDPRDLLVRDLANEKELGDCSRIGFELPALMAVPIEVDHRLLGVISLGARNPGQFDMDDINLVRGVARQAGQAIVNSLHREEAEARSRHSRQFVRF